MRPTGTSLAFPIRKNEDVHQSDAGKGRTMRRGVIARGVIRRLTRNVAGQGLVEFILVVPVFMTLFFGIFEFSRYYTTRLRIRTAVAEGTRYATTGNFLTDADSGDPLSRAVSIRETILANVGHFGVTSDNITLDPADGGGPEDVVTVTVDYEYQVATPVMEHVFGDGVLDFTVSTSMRNEPFFQ